MVELCPIQTGSILMLISGAAMVLYGVTVTQYVALIVGVVLALLMLTSLCKAGRVTAGWVTAMLSPLVIVLFASQVEMFIRAIYS